MARDANNINTENLMSTRQLSELPTEIVLKIFKDLNAPSLWTMTTLHERLQAIAEDICLKEADLSKITDDFPQVLEFLYGRNDRLEVLSLPERRYYINRQIAMIERLITNNGEFLQRLTLPPLNTELIDGKFTYKIEYYCTHLTELNICGELSRVREECTMKYWESIRIQNRGKCVRLCDLVLKIIENNPNLQHIRLENWNYGILDLNSIARTVAAKCPRLKTFSSSHSKGLDPSVVNAFSSCVELRELNLDWSINSFGGRLALSSSTLESLAISGLMGVEDYLFWVLLGGCPKLKDLRIENIRIITFHTEPCTTRPALIVQNAIIFLKHLQRITTTGCGLLVSEVRELQEWQPHITIINN